MELKKMESEASTVVTMQRIHTGQERRLLLAMCVSDELLAALAPTIRVEYFTDCWSRRVVGWVLDYFSQQHEAPKGHVHDLFLRQAKLLDQTEADLIFKFLALLSDEYVANPEINVPFMLGEAQDFFNKRSIELLVGAMQLAMDSQNVPGALALVQDFQPPVIGGGCLSLEEALFSPECRLVLPFDAFAKLTIPPRHHLIFPWLQEGDIVLITGAPAVGKTALAMEIARTASQGDWGMAGLWDANDQWTNTLYVDGELPLADLQDRAKRTGLARGGNCTLLSKMAFEAADVSFNLVEEKHRDLLMQLILKGNGVEPFGLVILDNLFSLFAGMDLKDDVAWAAINAWLLRLRAKKITVILLHHVTKKGDQFGTITKEFNITTSLLLRSAKAQWEDHVAFTISVTKQREQGLGLVGKKFQFIDGAWRVEDSQDDLRMQVALALVAGKKQADIVKDTGKSKGWISILKKELLADDLLEAVADGFIFTAKGEEWLQE